jgi:hypothetical protein
MGTEHHPHSTSHSALNHETSDVNLTGITRLAIASFLVIVMILGFVWVFEKGLARFLTDTTQPPPMADWKANDNRTPKAPLVITDEPGLLRQLRTEESHILDNYAWVDKGQGVVRIPIDRALELVAKNPALLAPQGAPQPPTPPGPPAPSTGTASTPPPAGH